MTHDTPDAPKLSEVAKFPSIGPDVIRPKKSKPALGRGLMSLFQDESRREDQPRRLSVLDASDGQTAARTSSARRSRVYITIGAGETQITAYGEDMRKDLHFVADAGWASLCLFPIEHLGEIVTLDETSLLRDAMTGDLCLYGESPDLTRFTAYAKTHFSWLVSSILDRTIGSGKKYIEIVVSSPDFIQPYMTGVEKLRPHLKLDTEENTL